MAQQQQQGGGSDNSMAPIWMTILAVITIYIIWYSASGYIVSAIFQLNLIQIKIIKLFINSTRLDAAMVYMQSVDPKTVSWQNLMLVTATVGFYLRFPVAGILAFAAFYLYHGNISLKFRKVHNMKTLGQQEQNNWTAIMPVLKEDLVAEDISKGPWAMAMTPYEFCQKFQLLRKDDKLLDTPMPGMEMTAGIRSADAKRVFTLQLGPYWEGIERSQPHVAALAAVFMARINRDKDNAGKILSTLDKESKTGKMNFAVAKPILKKYHNTPLVQEVFSKHAYLLTVMASLLRAARLDGVVPTAEFLWLKPLDRRLWYMLNSVGRQTPFAEVGGPFAHWLAENAIGRPSLVPMIDQAITALEVAIKEIKLTPAAFRELQP